MHSNIGPGGPFETIWYILVSRNKNGKQAGGVALYATRPMCNSIAIG